MTPKTWQFTCQKGLMHLSKRLVIACISNKAESDTFVKITEEWYKNPILPDTRRNIQDLMHPAFCKDAASLKFYIESMCEDKQLDSSNLYLSMFPSSIDEMDDRYEAVE